MKSGTSIALVALLVLGAAGVVAAAPAAGAGAGDAGPVVGDPWDVENVSEDGDANATGDEDGNDGIEGDDGSDDETRPGERLAGVIGVQGAEIDGEVESRSLERRVAADRDEEARADAIDEQLRENEARLDEIEARQRELREQRAAGEIREGEFRARMARLVARTKSIERTTNRSAAAANDLPRERLDERGVDAERIRTLRNRSSELSGPEVAEMARGIAGPNVGGPAGGSNRPDHAGHSSMTAAPGERSSRNVSNSSSTAGVIDGGGPPDGVSEAGPPDNANGGVGTSTGDAVANSGTESPREPGNAVGPVGNATAPRTAETTHA